MVAGRHRRAVGVTISGALLAGYGRPLALGFGRVKPPGFSVTRTWPGRGCAAAAASSPSPRCAPCTPTNPTIRLYVQPRPTISCTDDPADAVATATAAAAVTAVLCNRVVVAVRHGHTVHGGLL